MSAQQPPAPTHASLVNCNCEMCCHGGKLVSQRTYDRHAPHRQAKCWHAASVSSSSESDTDDSDEEDSSSENSGDTRDSPAQKKPRLSRDSLSDLNNPIIMDDLLEVIYLSDIPSETSESRWLYNTDDTPAPILSDSNSESDSESEDCVLSSPVKDLQTALDFVSAVKNASLDNGDLDAEALERLRNPPREVMPVLTPADTGGKVQNNLPVFCKYIQSLDIVRIFANMHYISLQNPEV
ncbi:hypothetical protein C8R43DRAFT_953495 [Mycena crocata]|nr:hypothetical protein C8R43DRAFT_953495 [Mycena crocata]